MTSLNSQWIEGTPSSRTVGDNMVTVEPCIFGPPSTSGWLLAVGQAHLCVSDNEADALLTLLLTRMYRVSGADVEIALTTLASLDPDEQVMP